jgi:hypothetical protein
LTRADWGCDESLRFSGSQELWPRHYVPVKKLVVHHTATERLLTTDAEIEAEVRAIYTYHARTLGWGDIGYGALIGLNGKSYEGRYGRGSGSTREIFSQDVVAGHAYEHNYGATGVALIGWFHPPYNMQPTTSMLNRLLDVSGIAASPTSAAIATAWLPPAPATSSTPASASCATSSQRV